MAPPARRRPGFSRRAQYSLFIGYVFAVLGVLTGSLLLITAHYDPEGNLALRALLNDIASPISSVGRAVVRGVSGAGQGVAAYIDAGSKNRAMQAELAASRTMLIAGHNAELENRRLHALLHMAQTNTGPLIAARLISSTGESSRRYAMIDKGSLQHIMVGQPVVAPEGLVGQVVQTGLISSRVLLISDAGNIVPVKRVSDGVTGLASGTGEGLIAIHPLTPGYNPFKAGNVFVTSGAGGVYPPGIPVAMAVSADHDGVNARALADPDSLDVALVEQPFVAPLPAPIEIKAKTKKHRKDDQ